METLLRVKIDTFQYMSPNLLIPSGHRYQQHYCPEKPMAIQPNVNVLLLYADNAFFAVVRGGKYVHVSPFGRKTESLRKGV